MADQQPPTSKKTPVRQTLQGYERPVGHAVVAMFVAILVGLIFNAHGLMSTARQLPYGSTSRTVSVAFMRPINSVTGALYLDAPASGLRWALGRSSQGTNGDPFKVAPVTTSVSPPPSSSGGGSSTPPPSSGGTSSTTGPTQTVGLPQPTKSQPLKLLVMGDSLAGDFGQTLYEDAEKTGVIKPAGPVDYHISTGLTRPDIFDWPGELQNQIAKYHPSTIVIALGLNDGQQTMTLPDGTFLGTGTPGWLKEYRRRVGAMMDIALGSGARVVYVAPPPTSNSSANPYLFSINVQVVKAAQERAAAGAASVFTYPRFADHLKYTAYLPIGGKQVLVRTPDGIHTTQAGSDILSDMVMKSLRTIYKLPPAS